MPAMVINPNPRLQKILKKTCELAVIKPRARGDDGDSREEAVRTLFENSLRER